MTTSGVAKPVRTVFEVQGPASGPGGPDPDQAREAALLATFARLKQAGLLADPDARIDRPSGLGEDRFFTQARLALRALYGWFDGTALSGSQRAVLRELIGDVDRDGRPEVDLDKLLASGLLAEGTTAELVHRAMTEAPLPQDVFEAQVPAATRQPGSAIAAGLAPGLRSGQQTTVDLAVLLQAQPPATRQTEYASQPAAHAVVPVAYVLTAQGKVEPFAGQLPEGARLLSRAELRVDHSLQPDFDGYGRAAMTLLLCPEDGGFAVQVEIAGSNRSGAPEVSRDMLERIIADLDRSLVGETRAGAPLLAEYLAHVKRQRDFLAGPCPADPARAILWRAGNVGDEQFEAARSEVQRRHGVRPLRWLGYADDVRETPLAQAVLDAALPAHGISPSFLYTIAIGEGVGLWLNDHTGLTSQDLDAPVNGYQYIGVDTFGSKVQRLKSKGLIPASWQEGVHYTTDATANELGQQVRYGSFHNLRDGLTALAAMLADYRQSFLADARSILGPQQAARLSEEQINFFTYLYFNAGEGFGRKQLQASGLGFYRPWQGEAPGHNRNARFNALQRIATWQLFERLTIFRPNQPLV